MKMKLSPEVIVVIILFILVIFIANYGSCRGGPSTYNSVSTFSKQFAYEGFETGEKKKDNEEEIEGSEQPVEKMTQEKEQTEPMTSKAKETKENIFQKFTNTFTSLFSKERQESFTTMSPSQVNDAYKKLDVVGDLPAKAECIGKSHGYSKSTGGVCWDAQTEKLLLSRGGQSCGSCTARQ